MTDSLKKAKAIAGLEFSEPMAGDLEEIQKAYDKGEITYEEAVKRAGRHVLGNKDGES